MTLIPGGEHALAVFEPRVRRQRNRRRLEAASRENGPRLLDERIAIVAGHVDVGDDHVGREDAEIQGNELAAALGCTDTNAPLLLACLRSKSRDQVVQARPPAQLEQILETGRSQWTPIVDGFEIPDRPRILFRRGAFSRVPVMLGAYRDDGWTFVNCSCPRRRRRRLHAGGDAGVPRSVGARVADRSAGGAARGFALRPLGGSLRATRFPAFRGLIDV